MPGKVGPDRLVEWMRRYADVIHDNAAELTELDSAIGDADHGSNMDRGMRAVVTALDDGGPDSAAALFKKVGMTVVSSVGGASGPLYGTLFLCFGAAKLLRIYVHKFALWTHLLVHLFDHPLQFLVVTFSDSIRGC